MFSTKHFMDCPLFVSSLSFLVYKVPNTNLKITNKITPGAPKTVIHEAAIALKGSSTLQILSITYNAPPNKTFNKIVTSANRLSAINLVTAKSPITPSNTYDANVVVNIITPPIF